MNQLRTDTDPPMNLGVHDPKVINGYTDEMLNGAISELNRVEFPGEWEVERLALLNKERDRRHAPKPRVNRRPLDTVACKDG